MKPSKIILPLVAALALAACDSAPPPATATATAPAPAAAAAAPALKTRSAMLLFGASLANKLGQYDSTVTPAAFKRVLIFSAYKKKAKKFEIGK